jgi:hypothetical protein
MPSYELAVRVLVAAETGQDDVAIFHRLVGGRSWADLRNRFGRWPICSTRRLDARRATTRAYPDSVFPPRREPAEGIEAGPDEGLALSYLVLALLGLERNCQAED